MPVDTKEQVGFAITPKLDCPHLNDEKVKDLIDFLLHKNSKHFSLFQCNQCQDTTENWICLQCQVLGCSRYVKSHMAEHNAKTKHSIALSFSDASFWCYDCESYIEAAELRHARIQLSKSKFAIQTPKLTEEEEEVLKQLEKLVIEQNKQEDKQTQAQAQKKQEQKKQEQKTYQCSDLIKGLQNKQYKKIVVLTGAGLSVAAGIPDFRTPGTGLYSQLQKYKLPYPEAVFQLGFYVKNPQPFLRVAKEHLTGDFHPTLGHKFIKKLQDQGVLYKNLTQNIDDLQTKAGISPEKLIQAHGHSRSAHCIKHLCQKEASIQKWKEHLDKLEAMKCESCGGLVKPDIIFFGEQLPKQFFQGPEIVEKADLVFIIGTSLAVAPFSFLGTMIPKQCPLVLINNQDSIPYRKDKLWLKGDIQEDIKNLMTELGWK